MMRFSIGPLIRSPMATKKRAKHKKTQDYEDPALFYVKYATSASGK